MVARQKARLSKSKSTLSFNHALIYVRDVDRALTFYQGLLGFEIEHVPGYSRLQSPAGRNTIALHQFGPEQEIPSSDAIRLYFEVKRPGGAVEASLRRGSG